MMNRLKQRLEPRDKKKSSSSTKCQTADTDFDECPVSDALDGFRDMDDEEVDGDLFQKDETVDDDFNDAEEDDIVTDLGPLDNDKQPKKVRILPLYSMLSTDEQSEVFSPVSDDTRLIVVATNIAETVSCYGFLIVFLTILHRSNFTPFFPRHCVDISLFFYLPQVNHNPWNFLRRR